LAQFETCQSGCDLGKFFRSSMTFQWVFSQLIVCGDSDGVLGPMFLTGKLFDFCIRYCCIDHGLKNVSLIVLLRGFSERHLSRSQTGQSQSTLVCIRHCGIERCFQGNRYSCALCWFDVETFSITFICGIVCLRYIRVASLTRLIPLLIPKRRYNRLKCVFTVLGAIFNSRAISALSQPSKSSSTIWRSRGPIEPGWFFMIRLLWPRGGCWRQRLPQHFRALRGDYTLDGQE